MSTKQKPGAFDCYANAEPDEEQFVLLARDASAPMLVRQWADIREMLIAQGVKPESDREQVIEARGCAARMEAWRSAHAVVRASDPT